VSPAQGRGRRRLTATEVDLGVVRQRAVVVGVAVGSTSIDDVEGALDELALLVDTAGADPVARMAQRRPSPDPATYLGAGKLDELRTLAEAEDADVVVFDDELSPAQQRNLEQALGRDVVDRVALILDIFALHARSREGMLQVELAQLRYRLPRLRGRGVQLSRLGAGIGTRGPGETQLETDRRRILRRISKLEADLDKLAQTRATQRKARRRSERLEVALVGYTNAGKSTVLNRLTRARVLVEDRLFSTLDPTVRQLRLGGGETAVLSDTVGFVRKLPHQLVEAFRSTLEELTGADLLVHIVDGAAAEPEQHIEAVQAVLREIGASDVPELIVVNKIDDAPPTAVARLLRAHVGSVAVSARTGEGMEALRQTIADRLRATARVEEFVVPLDRGDVVAALHRDGEVLSVRHGEGATTIRARLSPAGAARFEEFRVGRGAAGDGS
jgi:GTP-binding protein HflX